MHEISRGHVIQKKPQNEPQIKILGNQRSETKQNFQIKFWSLKIYDFLEQTWKWNSCEILTIKDSPGKFLNKRFVTLPKKQFSTWDKVRSCEHKKGLKTLIFVSNLDKNCW